MDIYRVYSVGPLREIFLGGKKSFGAPKICKIILK